MLESACFRALRYPELLQHILDLRTELSKEKAIELARDALIRLRNAGQQSKADSLRSSIGILISHGAGSDLLANVAVGNAEQVLRLLDSDKKHLSVDENRRTILHSRLLLEQPELLEIVLGRTGKILVDQADDSGITCLHLACQQDLLESSLRIMKFKPDIDKADSYGRTALHHACMNCNVAMVMALLANGANAEARDKDGDTPWDYAKISNSVTLARKTHFRIVFSSRYSKGNAKKGRSQYKKKVSGDKQKE